ncbi:MAG: hypothetical protein OXM55_02385 [Bdellovibrionales bacterium]|nr:hypothetical protein [Bdellovibrionales bacterium]
MESEFEAIFEAFKSNKKTIGHDELKILPRTQEAEQLKRDGYTTAYTKGIDEVNEWMAVKQRLTELKANPHTTHIDYFADKVESHIAHIRQGLQSPPGSQLRRMQLMQLRKLEKKAKEVVANKGVTYKWWLEFNNELSSVAKTTRQDRVDERNSKDQINSLLGQFPLHILMPTLHGEVGIKALNRANTHGIHPLGLTNEIKIAEGKKMTSQRFFSHDLLHAKVSIYKMIGSNTHIYRELYGKMEKAVKGLPVEKRKRTELAYFILHHESIPLEGTNVDRVLQSPPSELKAAVTQIIRSQLEKGHNFTGVIELPESFLDSGEMNRVLNSHC